MLGLAVYAIFSDQQDSTTSSDPLSHAAGSSEAHHSYGAIGGGEQTTDDSVNRIRGGSGQVWLSNACKSRKSRMQFSLLVMVSALLSTSTLCFMFWSSAASHLKNEACLKTSVFADFKLVLFFQPSRNAIYELSSFRAGVAGFTLVRVVLLMCVRVTLALIRCFFGR